MKRIFFILVALLSIFILSCKTTHLEGVFVCDASAKKADTTIHHKGYDEVINDFTCIFSELDFIGKSTVKIKTEGGSVVFTYTIDGDNVLLNTGTAILLLKMKSEHTLVGEGLTQGTYNKK